mmetsp:Transcript_16472/g.29707  ORF Transcript_16472/g.29707 Transcript_16472/m.29707 type:complete len:231 (+) Transcript_16472:731-1423(+)
MESDLEGKFLSSLVDLSTAKEKIYEVAGIMIDHQKTHAATFTQLWLTHLGKAKDERRKLAMLYVMNEVVFRNSRAGKGEEYLKAFSEVMDEVVNILTQSKSENLLDDLRKIVLVWDEPENSIFIPTFTSKLRSDIERAKNFVIDERTGANIVQQFDLTRRLSALETRGEEHRYMLEHIDNILEAGRATGNLEGYLEEIKEKWEDQLVERSNLMIELSKLLEAEVSTFYGA